MYLLTTNQFIRIILLRFGSVIMSAIYWDTCICETKRQFIILAGINLPGYLAGFFVILSIYLFIYFVCLGRWLKNLKKLKNCNALRVLQKMLKTGILHVIH